MEEYYNRINAIVLDLLLPVRTQKIVDKKSFDILCGILDELAIELKGEEQIPRKIAGLLFFIYCSLSDNVLDNNYQNELFGAVGKLEELLDRVFWDSPFKE